MQIHEEIDGTTIQLLHVMYPVERDCNTITVLLLLFQINNQSINQSIKSNRTRLIYHSPVI